MANFPIEHTTRTLTPATSGVKIPPEFADYPARTGELLGNTLVRLGAAGIEEAGKWNRLDASIELSKATRDAGLRINRLADELANESDWTQYETLGKYAVEDIKALRPEKNTLAGRTYDDWTRQQEVEINRAVGEAIRRRRHNDAVDDLQKRKGDFLGQFEGLATNVILRAGGTREALDIAQSREMVSQAERAGATTEDLMLSVRRASTMADQIRNEEKNREEKAGFLTVQQRQSAVTGFLRRIDAGDSAVGPAITIAPELAGVDGQEVMQRLVEWNGNRFSEPTLRPAMGTRLLDEAIRAAERPADQQYEFRLKLADARYGRRATLDHSTYAMLAQFMDRNYPPYELAVLRSGLNAIKTNPGKDIVATGFMGGGWAGTLPVGPEERLRQSYALLRWFDAQRGKGKLPTLTETVTEARALGVHISVVGDEDRRREALEGLSDQGRDAALRQWREQPLDDPAIPWNLRTKIRRARDLGWSDEQIMETPEWQEYESLAAR
jgi:hypothetical protein